MSRNFRNADLVGSLGRYQSKEWILLVLDKALHKLGYVGFSTTVWLAKDQRSPRLGYAMMVEITFAEQSLKPNTETVGLIVS
jgi:hypothetical protein